MAPTAPSSPSNASDEATAVAMLDALEVERGISMDLLEESEVLMTAAIRALDKGSPRDLVAVRDRVRRHLTALRSFLGGGFNLDTKES